MLDAVFFYFFAALTLGGATLTISQRSAVLSAVWLTVSLLGVAGLFLLQGAEFLFAAQIILYIGGVTLLFLFVIMLVNLDAAAQVRQFRGSWPALLLAALGLAIEFITLLTREKLPIAQVSAATGNTQSLADVLLSRYAIAFEAVSVLLLVAIVGSVWMGHQRVRGGLEAKG